MAGALACTIRYQPEIGCINLRAVSPPKSKNPKLLELLGLSWKLCCLEE